MLKSWKRSIVEGILFALIIFAIIEFTVEGILHKTGEVIEFLQLSPYAPKSLELYYNVQVSKCLCGLILSVIGIIIAKVNFDGDKFMASDWNNSRIYNIYSVHSNIVFLPFSCYLEVFLLGLNL